MRGYIIAVLIIFSICVIFALQNTALIHVKVLYWTPKCPVSVLFISIFFIGGLVGILFSFPTIKKKNEKLIDQTRKLKDKEDKKSQ
jgi:uncharacterized integral membrane protein